MELDGTPTALKPHQGGALRLGPIHAACPVTA